MNLLDLPDETIEGIFEHIQEDDIFRLKLVNKAINLVIAGSVGIQYRLELFLAGLEDHRSDGPEPLGERLNKLRSWQLRWDQAGTSPSQIITLPGRYATGKCCLYGGVFAMQNEDIIHFIRLPSPSRGVPLISWSIPRLGFEPVGTFAIDPGQDLLVLAERRTVHTLAVRIFDMHGRHHPQSAVHSVFLHLEKLLLPGSFIKSAQITIAGPNAAALVIVGLEREDRWDSLWVFDWTSGRSKLRLKRLNINNVTFIDEFHLVTSSLDPRDGRSYCLRVHDLRQRSPHVLFELPPHASSIYFNPGLFCRSYPGPISAFHGSPAHAVLAVVMLGRIGTRTTLVVVHPQSLYGLMEQEDSYIQWEQWKNRAEFVNLETFWNELGDELQITAGLRLITPLSRWYNHEKNPKLRLHTFQPWMPPRGDTAFRGMRSRTRDLPFSIPDSSPDLVSLISEEHVLWIDPRPGDVHRLTIFSL